MASSMQQRLLLEEEGQQHGLPYCPEMLGSSQQVRRDRAYFFKAFLTDNSYLSRSTMFLPFRCARKPCPLRPSPGR